MRAALPERGNDPVEVEDGGTKQICFAYAAPLRQGTNLLSGGLKVAAPISSARVAPTDRRAHAVPAPSSTARNRRTEQQCEAMLGAGGTLASCPHHTAEPRRAGPTFAEVQLQQQQLEEQQPGERRPAHAARSLRGSAPCAGCAPLAAARRPHAAPPTAARRRDAPPLGGPVRVRAAATRNRPRARGSGTGWRRRAAPHLLSAVLRYPAPLCSFKWPGGVTSAGARAALFCFSVRNCAQIGEMSATCAEGHSLALVGSC